MLAAEGATGVRADRIATRLGLTKGSFHHHFAGMDDYRHALLARHQEDQLARLDRIAAEVEDAPADVALAALPDRLSDLFDADLERAVRSWAVVDPVARAVQEQLDGARLAFLRHLWSRIVGDERQAHLAALVPHLIAIGASMVQPRMDANDLRAVFDLLSELAPRVPRRPAP